MTAHGIQMQLNLALAPTFFGIYPAWGQAALWLTLLLIATLALAVTATVILFSTTNTTAGVLMLALLFLNRVLRQPEPLRGDQRLVTHVGANTGLCQSSRPTGRRYS